MAKKELSLVGDLVKKHNELARARIDIDSVQASKILASLIACIHTNDIEFKKSYCIAVKDILPDLGGGNYRQIKNICDDLRKAGVAFEDRDPFGDITYITASFFSRVNYNKGIIEASFSSDPIISNCLLELRKKFTEYRLDEYLKLPSIYSQRMFEILKSWSKNKEPILIELSKLNRILNTPISFRKDFKEFRIYVLEKSYKDIHKHTSLKYEWEPIKVGRSVEKIQFTFGAKKMSLAESEKDKAKQEKQVRLRNARFVRAVRCFEAKGKECKEQTEKRIVCKLCCEMGICTGNLKETAK